MDRVSDKIGDEYKKWKAGSTIFINAPTGSGKTYFILNKLLPYAAENGRKTVYYVNRISLQQQIEKTIKDDYSKYADNIDVRIYQKVEHVIKKNQNAQSNQHYFVTKDYNDNALRLRQCNNMPKNAYVVYDEAHYLISDSEFNTDVVNFTEQINQADPRLIHIFMTATPPYMAMMLYWYFLENFKPNLSNPFLLSLLNPYYFHSLAYSKIIKEYDISGSELIDFVLLWKEISVLDSVPLDSYKNRINAKYFQDKKQRFSEEVNRIWNLQPSSQFTIAENKYYPIPDDYSYINPVYYKDMSDIVEAISNIAPKDDKNDSIEETEKWLIFVKNVEEGYDLVQSLAWYGVPSVFIHVQNKQRKGSPQAREYKNIVNKGRFECRVLITTKIFENGVNFQDPMLKHIVIQSYNETTFKQMLGRKRHESDIEKINVYLQDTSEGMIRNHFSNHTVNRIFKLFKYLDSLYSGIYPKHVNRNINKMANNNEAFPFSK